MFSTTLNSGSFSINSLVSLFRSDSGFGNYENIFSTSFDNDTYSLQIADTKTGSLSSHSHTAFRTSAEIYRNSFRFQQIDSALFSRMVSLLMEDDCESGVVSDAEKYFCSYFSGDREKERVAYLTLSEIVVKYNNNPQIITAILHMISHIPPREEIKMIVFVSLNHTSPLVCEYAVKCVENWQDKSMVKLLKKISCQQKWLKDYIDAVIADLELL